MMKKIEYHLYPLLVDIRAKIRGNERHLIKEKHTQESNHSLLIQRKEQDCEL